MMQRLSCLFYGFLKIAANAQRLGLGMIRVAILIIFVWIGGLKFWNYEAEGIVPFVANSPFMSFFTTKKHPSTGIINSRRANTTLKNMRGTSRTTPMAFPTGWGC